MKFGERLARNTVRAFTGRGNVGLDGKPANNPLQAYASKLKTGDDKAKDFLKGMGESKNLVDDPKYQAMQAERAAAVKGQFDSARGRLGQQEGQVKDEISTGLQRLQARVGAVGGSVEKARAKALTETGREFAQAGTDLSAQEAAAQAGLKGEDVQRQFESEQMNKQLDQQNKQFAASYGLNVDQFNTMKDQFSEQMAFQYKEFDENQKTNLLNAAMALKKAGMDSKQFAKFFDELTGLYGDERTSSLKPVVSGYDKFLQGQRERYGIKGTPTNVWWEDKYQ